MTLTINSTVLRDYLLSEDADITAQALLQSRTMAGGGSARDTAGSVTSIRPSLVEDTTTAYLGCHFSISQGGHPSFDPNNLGEATTTPIGAFLVPILVEEDLHLLILACPRCPPTDGTAESPSVSTIMGTSGESSFTRTDSFDGSAITTGDSSFTMLSYEGTSPVSSLRFTSFILDERKDSSAFDSLFGDDKDTNRSKEPFRKRSTETWCIATDATSVGKPGKKRYSCSVPSIFPLPFGHNLTSMETIPVSDDMDPALLKTCGADTDWITKLPVFRLWISAVRTNPSHFTPTKITELRLDSSPCLVTHRLAVSVTRQIFADWDRTVNDDNTLFDLSYGKHLLEEPIFPPPAAARADNAAASLPSWDPPFSFTVTPPGFMSNPGSTTPAIATTNLPVAPQPPTGTNGNNIVAQPAAGISIKSHKVESWQLMTICSFQGRIITLDPLLATWMYPPSSAQGIPIGTISALGTIGSVTAEYLSHFACAPLSQGMQTGLAEHTASMACASFQNRFNRARTTQGAQHTVVEKIRSVSGKPGSFWSTTTWEKILSATFSTSKLDKDIAPEGFNILIAASIDPTIQCTTEGYPTFPLTGAESFSTISTIISLCQWFVLAITHSDYFHHTLLYQGLSTIEGLCADHSFAHRWSSPTFNRGMATLAVVQSIHDLWSAISQVAVLAVAVQPPNMAILRTDGSAATQATLCPPRRHRLRRRLVLGANAGIVVPTHESKLCQGRHGP